MQAHTHTLTDCNVRAPIAPLGLVGRYRTNKIVARRVIYWLAEAITVSNTRQSNPLKKYQRSIHPECSPRPLLTNTLGRSNTHTLSLSRFTYVAGLLRAFFQQSRTAPQRLCHRLRSSAPRFLSFLLRSGEWGSEKWINSFRPSTRTTDDISGLSVLLAGAR